MERPRSDVAFTGSLPLPLLMPNSSQVPALRWLAAVPNSTYLLVGVALITVQALILLAMGQPPICECGYVRLWHGSVASPENSQQLSDWYTLSHVIHGFGFYLLLWLMAPRAPIGLRFVAAVGLEVGWELLENSPFIIGRYRQTGLAQGYVGDSVVNSVSDTLAMALGFVLVRVLPVRVIVALAVVMELLAAFVIHDNLMLNIVQLIYPSASISGWQLAP